MKIAVLYIATGRYMTFWDDFHASAEKHFLPGVQKAYFVWTDDLDAGQRYDNVHVIPAARRGFPWDTLMRFEMFLEAGEELSKFDYIFFMNANIMFVGDVLPEHVLPRSDMGEGGLVAARHPYVDKNRHPDTFPYDRNPMSSAFIPKGIGKYYLSGAFNGGAASDYLKMAGVLANNTRHDFENMNVSVRGRRGPWAHVHDESHLNRYLLDREFRALDPSFGMPERSWLRMSDEARATVQLISRDKTSPKYGGLAWLRGQTDRRVRVNPVLKALLRVLGGLCPSRRGRRWLRSFYG